jgi:hypothetical protein
LQYRTQRAHHNDIQHHDASGKRAVDQGAVDEDVDVVQAIAKNGNAGGERNRRVRDKGRNQLEFAEDVRDRVAESLSTAASERGGQFGIQARMAQEPHEEPT